MKHDNESCPGKQKYLSGKRILPKPSTKDTDIVALIDNMDAYNGGRLRAACQLMREKYSAEDVTIGLSLAGALTPAGLGPSTVVPLMNHGFVDWLVATGANMYHDMHYAFNLPMYRGSHSVDDVDLRDKGVTRIYDILFDYEDVLMETDRILRKIMLRPEFQKEMGTREFYHHMGKVLDEYEKKNGLGEVSILAAAYRNGVPVFTSSPGDSTIGMNVARGGRAPGQVQAEDQPEHRRERLYRDHPERQAVREGQDRGHTDRWREPQELHAPDRAADPGGADDPGSRPGLRHQRDRRAA